MWVVIVLNEGCQSDEPGVFLTHTHSHIGDEYNRPRLKEEWFQVAYAGIDLLQRYIHSFLGRLGELVQYLRSSRTPSKCW